MDKESRVERLRGSLSNQGSSVGNLCVEAFHYFALFGIGAVTAFATFQEFWSIIIKGSATIDDILLLFIYLELGAMVGIYFKTNHMPVRFLIYVAITALTRMLISHISHHEKPDMGLVYLTGSILILAAAVIAVRFASSRYPSDPATRRRGDPGES